MALPHVVPPFSNEPPPAVDIHDHYLAHAATLRRWLTARLRDPEAAQDIAQEAYLRLVREVQLGRSPNDPAAWLHRVAANLATTRGRRISVADRYASRIASSDVAPGPEDGAVEAEEMHLLRDALATLPACDRAALLLAAAGYRGSEIAQQIGRSRGATRTLICRARARVRERLLTTGYARG